MRRLLRLGLLQRFTHRLLTGFVVLWLAVIYPTVCQYHGALFFTAAPPQHPHTSTPMRHPAPGMKPEMAHASPHPVGQAAQPRLWHKPLPVETTPMSLLGVSLPAATMALERPHAQSSRTLVAPAMGHQHQPSPPVRPPRRLPA